MLDIHAGIVRVADEVFHQLHPAEHVQGRILQGAAVVGLQNVVSENVFVIGIALRIAGRRSIHTPQNDAFRRGKNARAVGTLVRIAEKQRQPIVDDDRSRKLRLLFRELHARRASIKIFDQIATIFRFPTVRAKRVFRIPRQTVFEKHETRERKSATTFEKHGNLLLAGIDIKLEYAVIDNLNPHSVRTGERRHPRSVLNTEARKTNGGGHEV